MSQVAAWIAKRPRDSSLDSGKIQKKLKMKPLNITEGLNKMKEEMKT
jgi:dTDP-4-dehydrorhamnose reductase